MLNAKNVLLIVGTLFLVSSCTTTEQRNLERDDMIVARLDQRQEYEAMHPAFAKAFDFLQQENLADLPPGRYEVNGDSLFCTISRAPGKARAKARLEAHRKYIDIQYVIAGDEEMGWKPTADCSDVSAPYDDANDIMFFNDAIEIWKKVPPGSFAIFTPDDAHAPMVGSGDIHKVVCKILQ